MNDERDKLWEIMGRAKKPVVPPFFAAKVIRKVHESSPAPTIWEWLLQQWRLSGALAAMALLVIGFTLNHWREEARDTAVAQQVATSPDYEVVANLDELVAYQENSIWLDGSAE
jgi:hypothetical protein